MYNNNIYLKTSEIINYYYSGYSTLEERRSFILAILKSDKETKKKFFKRILYW